MICAKWYEKVFYMGGKLWYIHRMNRSHETSPPSLEYDMLSWNIMEHLIARWYRRISQEDFGAQQYSPVLIIPGRNLKNLLGSKHPQYIGPDLIAIYRGSLVSCYSIHTRGNYAYFTYCEENGWSFRLLPIPPIVDQVRKNVWSRIPPLIREEKKKEFYFNIDESDSIFVKEC